MVQQNSSITLSSLYSSGQCLLSVLGSIGVILLFAGIPQLIYSTPVNPGSLMTFLLGAILICLMVAGNAFIGYKYRQLVRSRREETRNSTSASREDKPPSYDDLLQEDGLPPDYASIIKKEKPPRYEDLVTEVYNWSAISKVHQIHHIPISPSVSAPSGYTMEMPIVVPLHRNLSQNFESTQPSILPHINLAYRSSSDDLRRAKHTQANSHSPTNFLTTKAKIQQHIKRSKSNNNVLSFVSSHNSSPCLNPANSTVQITNELETIPKPVKQLEKSPSTTNTCSSTSNNPDNNSSQL